VAVTVRCRFDDLIAGEAFELTDLRRELRADRLEDVHRLLDDVEAETGAGRYAAGFVAYEAAPAFDRALTVRAERAVGLPLAWFGIFATRRTAEPLRAPDEDPPGSWSSELDELGYGVAIGRIKERIAAGWTYQVNFTEQLDRPYPGDPFLLYRQLVSAQAGAYQGYFETDEFAIACGSPELFFALEGDRVISRPMKGTAARGRFPIEDAARAEGLLASAKERAENVMIVDLIRNDIGKIAVPGSVEVPEICRLERYPTLWQLTSTVEARLTEGTGLADVFAALFPCGSVTGAPKASTMALISELERSPRGAYCGAVGYVGPHAEHRWAQFAVGIRTAVVDRARGHASYGVGSGITWDSTEGGEWAELAVKTAVLAAAAGPFSLFETLRFEPGIGAVSLRRHLDRLAASADYFGFSYAEDELERVLRGALAGTAVVSRVRIVLGRDGAVRVDVEPLGSGEPLPIRLAIDLQPVGHRDPMLFHKTTDRDRYDSRAARHPDADDVVLVNDRAEVTETTRANLLVRIDGSWWTPALDCGLLPGVGRAALLESGAVGERILRIDDLRGAEEIATVSSLRGQRRALLVGADR
jgi:para-aminobenzoate synthetase/4-amino-4-deoxychorismate lyase